MHTSEWLENTLTPFDIKTSLFILVPENNTESEQNDPPSLRLYRVPLEHFPSLETYYPERKILIVEEIEPPIEVKPSKTTSSQAKKSAPIIELDKTTLLFDEKIKETFRKR